MKKRTIISLIAGAAALALVTVPAIAFYSAKATTRENAFSIVAGSKGETLGVIKEDTWHAEDAKDLVPGKSVNKDPVLTSYVDYGTYAYLGVTIPQVDAALDADEDTSVQDAINLVELNDTDWRLVDELDPTENAPKVLIYCNNGELEANGSTEKLFTQIQVPDFEICDSLEDSVNVGGYFVQYDSVDSGTADAEAIAYFTEEFQSED